MFEKIDKKSLLYLCIVLAIAILVWIGLFYYISQMPESEKEIGKEIFEEQKRERIVKQQLQELEELKEEDDLLTEEEIQKQLEELESLY